MKKLVLVGGGGHCRAAIDVIEMEGKFRIAGIVDTKEKLGTRALGYEIFATDDDLRRLVKEFRHFIVTVGQIKTATRRKELYEELKSLGAVLPVIISPLAHCSRHAEAGEGTIIMHHALVNSGARIGKNCILNTSCVVEHDSVIGDHCHISTGCLVNGGCQVGEGTFLGSNSVLANDISVGRNIVLGAGSAVVSPIRKKGTYAGNPARRLG